jgi:hypothetical protein
VLSQEVLTYDDVARALSAVGEVRGDNRTLHRIRVIRNRAGAVVGRGWWIVIATSSNTFRNLLS